MKTEAGRVGLVRGPGTGRQGRSMRSNHAEDSAADGAEIAGAIGRVVELLSQSGLSRA